jgi:xanthine/uracil permease
MMGFSTIWFEKGLVGLQHVLVMYAGLDGGGAADSGQRAAPDGGCRYVALISADLFTSGWLQTLLQTLGWWKFGRGCR